MTLLMRYASSRKMSGKKNQNLSKLHPCKMLARRKEKTGKEKSMKREKESWLRSSKNQRNLREQRCRHSCKRQKMKRNKSELDQSKETYQPSFALQSLQSKNLSNRKMKTCCSDKQLTFQIAQSLQALLNRN